MISLPSIPLPEINNKPPQFGRKVKLFNLMKKEEIPLKFPCKLITETYTVDKTYKLPQKRRENKYLTFENVNQNVNLDFYNNVPFISKKYDKLLEEYQ
jgi:hypothetical protein